MPLCPKYSIWMHLLSEKIRFQELFAEIMSDVADVK